MPLPESESAVGGPGAPSTAGLLGNGLPTAPKAPTAALEGSAPDAPRFPPAPGRAEAPGTPPEGRARGSGDAPRGSARGSRARKAPARARGADTPGAARGDRTDAAAEPAEGHGPLPAPSPPPAALEPRVSRAASRPSDPRPPAAPANGPGGWKARPVLELLRLRSCEVSVASGAVNLVVNQVLRGLRARESPFKGVELLNAGSYYERVKVSVPNEFDVMFKLEVPRIELIEYERSAAFCFVKFRRNPRGNPLNAFLEDDYLSASKMLAKFRELIKEEILKIDGKLYTQKSTSGSAQKTVQNAKNRIKVDRTKGKCRINVTMEEEKIGSPAVTLILEHESKKTSVDIILALELKSSWPISTQEGLPIHQWLGRKVRTKLRRDPFYLVAKPAKDGDHYQEKTWRLSFSNVEKKILNNHGETKTCCENEGVKCCRKECLKLMKYLLEQLKRNYEGCEEMEKFCSYQVKTAFFHMCSEFPSDHQWPVSKLELCFENFVKYFLQCLKTNQLPHFFIPEFNLFSEDLINKDSRDFLHKIIEYEMNNGFSVLFN